MKLARVLSVRTGGIVRHERPDWDEVRSEWRTAYWKSERQGPVQVDVLGLDGDQQADKRHHGGPEMAVLMYANEHYARWSREHGLEAMGPGGFGENLTLEGIDETGICVGDVLAVGEAELQVSSPRGPCMDISRRWNAPWLLERVVAERRPGWYLRVRKVGAVQAGDDVTLLQRPHEGFTIERVLAARYVQPRSRAELEAIAALAALAPEWRAQFAKLPAQS